MKSKILSLVLIFTISSIALAQENTKTMQLLGNPETDKTLLKDGSEKPHVTKKTKVKPTPAPTPEMGSKPTNPGALPTDVD